MGGKQRGVGAAKAQKPSTGSGPWVRCPFCGKKRHPGEMLNTDFYDEQVCYKCADDPKLLESAGSGVV